jgi:DNA oxidative demethylase
MPDQLDLVVPLDPPREIMAEGAVLLRGVALPFEKDLFAALNDITTRSQFRRMVTPGGYTMSVAMTNCGAAGWVTDRRGYRYDCIDPETRNPWPPMPNCFLDLAIAAATEAGYPGFRPDACLLIAMSPARSCPFIRTRTSEISLIRSSQFHWVCQRRSSSAA